MSIQILIKSATPPPHLVLLTSSKTGTLRVFSRKRSKIFSITPAFHPSILICSGLFWYGNEYFSMRFSSKQPKTLMGMTERDIFSVPLSKASGDNEAH